MIARRYSVTGRVQGVSFRAWLREEARHAGLSGWCRNRPDGSVEAVLCGERDLVAAMARVRRMPRSNGWRTWAKRRSSMAISIFARPAEVSDVSARTKNDLSSSKKGRQPLSAGRPMTE